MERKRISDVSFRHTNRSSRHFQRAFDLSGKSDLGLVVQYLYVSRSRRQSSRQGGIIGVWRSPTPRGRIGEKGDGYGSPLLFVIEDFGG